MESPIREQFLELGSECSQCKHVFVHKDRGNAYTFMLEGDAKTVCERCYGCLCDDYPYIHCDTCDYRFGALLNKIIHKLVSNVNMQF